MRTITTRFWARAFAAGVVAAVGLGLSGCGFNQVQRDDEGNIVEGNDEADVFSIRVGDCLNDAEITGDVTTTPVVPCSEPHDSEAYASIMMPDGPYPGQDAITAFAEEVCYDAYADFVGISWDDSALNYSYYSPTQGSWEQLDDREILCTVFDPEGKTTGTLKSSGR